MNEADFHLEELKQLRSIVAHSMKIDTFVLIYYPKAKTIATK